MCRPDVALAQAACVPYTYNASANTCLVPSPNGGYVRINVCSGAETGGLCAPEHANFYAAADEARVAEGIGRSLGYDVSCAPAVMGMGPIGVDFNTGLPYTINLSCTLHTSCGDMTIGTDALVTASTWQNVVPNDISNHCNAPAPAAYNQNQSNNGGTGAVVTSTSSSTPFFATTQSSSSWNQVLQESTQQLQEIQSQMTLLQQSGISASDLADLFSPAINQISQNLANIQNSATTAANAQPQTLTQAQAGGTTLPPYGSTSTLNAIQNSLDSILQESAQQLQEIQSQMTLLQQNGISASDLADLFSPAISRISQNVAGMQTRIGSTSSTIPTPTAGSCTVPSDKPWACTQIDQVTKWTVTPERCTASTLLKQAYQLMATAAASTPDIVANGGKALGETLSWQTVYDHARSIINYGPDTTQEGIDQYARIEADNFIKGKSLGTGWNNLYKLTPASTKYDVYTMQGGDPLLPPVDYRYTLHEWWTKARSTPPILFNPNYDGSLGRSTDLVPTTAVCPESGPVSSPGLVTISQQNPVIRVDDTINIAIIAGTAPYSVATPPGAGVATVLLSGTNLSITGVGRGQASFIVKDSSSPAITSTIKVSVNAKWVPYVAPETHQVTVTCLTPKVQTVTYWQSECYTPDYQFMAQGSGQYYALVPVPAAAQTNIITNQLPLSSVTTKQIQVEPINCAVWGSQDSAMKALIQQMGLFTPTYTSAGQDTCDSY
jgi:hypothetical protein